MKIDIKEVFDENYGNILLYIVWIVAPQLRNNGFKLITVVEGDFSKPRFPVNVISHLEKEENGKTKTYKDIGQEEFGACFQNIISSSNVQYKIKETYTLVKDHNYYREYA